MKLDEEVVVVKTEFAPSGFSVLYFDYTTFSFLWVHKVDKAPEDIKRYSDEQADADRQ